MIYNELVRLQNAKEAIKTAIESTGTVVPVDARLDEYASLIGGGEWHTQNPLRIVNQTESNSVTLYYKNAVGLEYSLDGTTWITPVESGVGTYLGYVTVPLRGVGSIMYFRAKVINVSSSYHLLTISGDVKLEGNFASLCEIGEGALCCNLGYIFFNSRIVEVGDIELPTPRSWYSFSIRNLFTNCTTLRKIGSITLQYNDIVLPNYYAAELFYGCTALEEVGDITIEDKTGFTGVFYQMFYNCKSLVNPPKLKTNSNKGESMFYGCFQGCSALEETAEIDIPSNITGNYIFRRMYRECTSLTQGVAYPTNSMGTYHYDNMYYGCTALTTAPQLPATTLANYCYNQMFYNCKSLTNAPELPATTLVSNCYYQMFTGCNKLNSITVRATSWNTSYANGWVANVSPTGEFHKKAGVTIATGTSGIPSGWAVVEDVD